MSPFEPGAQRAPEPKEPAGLAGRVGHAARQRPPDPKGKSLVIGLIAGAAVIAAIYQIATGSGAGKTVREQRAKDARAAEERRTDLVAPLAPDGDAPPRPRTPLPPPESALPPAPAPTSIPTSDAAPPPVDPVTLPPGIGGATASNLRLALGAIRSGYTLAAADLPRLVAAAGERERPLVRGVVVETLAELAGVRSTRGLALDAALALTADGQGGLEPLVEAAVAAVEDGDDTAAEALVFLRHLPGAQGAPGVEALAVLMGDNLRQLHLRVLAARVLAGWGAAVEARRALGAREATPEVLRQALRSE